MSIRPSVRPVADESQTRTSSCTQTVEPALAGGTVVACASHRPVGAAAVGDRAAGAASDDLSAPRRRNSANSSATSPLPNGSTATTNVSFGRPVVVTSLQCTALAMNPNGFQTSGTALAMSKPACAGAPVVTLRQSPPRWTARCATGFAAAHLDDVQHQRLRRTLANSTATITPQRQHRHHHCPWFVLVRGHVPEMHTCRPVPI